MVAINDMGPRAIVEWSAVGIEMLAIVLIVVAIASATVIYLYHLGQGSTAAAEHYLAYKHRLGRALLLCLEILVAADIVRTVALDSTIQSVLALGLLVLVRTFLSWSLILEVEGHWPWDVPPVEGSAPKPTPADAYTAEE